MDISRIRSFLTNKRLGFFDRGRIRGPNNQDKKGILPFIISRPVTVAFVMGIGLLLSLWVTSTAMTNISVADELENLHKSGKILDPIDALIFLDRAHTKSSFLSFIISSFGTAAIMAGFTFGLSYLVAKLLPSYVFYWGDQVKVYDQRISVLKVIWITIGLGTLVSVLGGLVLKFMNF